MSGEPAFPIYANGLIHDGMTLRDWFAGQALLSIVIHDTEESRSYSDVARMSYEQADAMMTARKAMR